MWYFVKPSHACLLRKKKFFDIKAAKKEFHFLVKQFATYILSNKDTVYPISSIIFFHLQRPFHVK